MGSEGAQRPGHRVISGLRWAKARPDAAPWGKVTSARGAKAQGIRYERALARSLPQARHGLWFEFLDENGPGWCQPDVIMRRGPGLVVLEAKYTWVPQAHSQLELLYRPVLEAWGQCEVRSIVVVKKVTPSTPNIVGTLEEALGRDGPVVWHWLGRGLAQPLAA